jgi:predicted alpha/beta hydrolase
LKGSGLGDYATTCGEVLAKGHARSGDPVVLAGYLGSGERWDKALSKFAISYADQSTKDYEDFKKAIKAGKIRCGEPYL